MGAPNEVNSIRWPEEYDTDLNWPAVTQVTEDTGEEINRNRDAILRLERILGLNPHIGLFTEASAVATATIGQRISLIEQNLAEGRLDLLTLNIGNVFVVDRDPLNVPYIHIGTKEEGENVATPVVIRGPLTVEDSLLPGANQATFHVPLHVRQPGAVGEPPTNPSLAFVSVDGISTDTRPIVHIRDFAEDPYSNLEHYVLLIEGNVKVTNGKLIAEYAIEHDTLLGIHTTPSYDRVTGNITEGARHVAGGDFHSHKKGDFNEALGRFIVDPLSTNDSYGVIHHTDLEGIFTTTNQEEPYYPDLAIPYHVTGGDEHNHEQGRGAQIRHESLGGIDPSQSHHVTGGDSHTHTSGDGALIHHSSIAGSGLISHFELDDIARVQLPDHFALIDSALAEELDPLKSALGHHVPQGHVSDPSAHHSRYTDKEATEATVEIVKNTSSYDAGAEASLLTHIQTMGTGTPSVANPHGLRPIDINALEAFDNTGQVPTSTQTLIENAVAAVGQGFLPGPFGAPSENALETGLPYRVVGGIKLLDTNPTTTIVTGLASVAIALVGAKSATAGVTFWVENPAGSITVTHTSTSGADEVWWYAIGLTS